MKIWLDDIREPWKWGRVGWTWTKTCDETIEALKNNEVTELDLDHDLTIEATIGLDCKEKTGYHVLLWIEEQVFTKGYDPPKMYVHTANPSAAPKMRAAVERIERFINERDNDSV